MSNAGKEGSESKPGMHRRAHVVIMAGGVGSRFWPLSTAERPKQFLKLAGGERSLLRATWERVNQVVPPERVWVVTTASMRALTHQELPELPTRQILAEPLGRNTAPCIGWAASEIADLDPEAPIAFLPADHFIAHEEAFARTIHLGLAASMEGSLVTVGIDPTRPETGFGYIEVGSQLEGQLWTVQRFVEKPEPAKAKEFLLSGAFLWNSGMFFFRADAILSAIARHLPALSEGLDTIRTEGRGANAARVLEAVYPKLPAISIDHGVMEKVQSSESPQSSDELGARVAVIRDNRSLGWSDLGSWTAAWELAPKDRSGNALTPTSIPVGARDCYVRSNSDKIIALVGVEGLVVVDTPDALLVVHKDRAQEVRQAVNAIKLGAQLDKD